jgi:hypothetical protein
MRKRSTLAPALPSKADSPPDTTKTKSSEEPELLRKILIEAKHLRGPASETASSRPR